MGILIGVFSAAVFMDWRYYRIPNVCTAAGMVNGLILTYMSFSWLGLVRSLGAAVSREQGAPVLPDALHPKSSADRGNGRLRDRSDKEALCGAPVHPGISQPAFDGCGRVPLSKREGV